MRERPQEEAIQDARLGNGKMFVLASPASVPVAAQATALFDAVSNTVAANGGWLVDGTVRASKARGFASLMESRPEMAWEELCPSGVGWGEVKRPIQLARRTPLTMLSVSGYPCWALDKHLYTIDLFNPGNELGLPYEDRARRLWAVYLHPPTLVLPNHVFTSVLVEAATAVGAEYGFGGQWLPQAIYAYRFAAWSDNNYLKPLDPSVRLTDLSYPYMLLKAEELSAGLIERLRSEEFSVRRAGRPEAMTTCDLLGRPGKKYVFLRLGPIYPDANDDLVTRVGILIRKPYAKTMIVREGEGSQRELE